MIGMGGGVGRHRCICPNIRRRRAREFTRCRRWRSRRSVCSSEGGGLEGPWLVTCIFEAGRRWCLGIDYLVPFDIDVRTGPEGSNGREDRKHTTK